MKKILMAMIIAVVMTASADASQISWANATEIYDWSGAGNLVLESYTDYVVRLYESVDGTINFGILGGVATNSADDTWTGIQFNWASGGDNGFGTAELFATDSTYGIAENDKIYSVIFSSSPNSGYFAIIDDSLATVSYPGSIMGYDAGGVVGGLQSAGGDWQAIPEPATGMLLAIGGGIAWLIRLKRRYY